MQFIEFMNKLKNPAAASLPRRKYSFVADIVTFVILGAIAVSFAHGVHEMSAPIGKLNNVKIDLDPAHLPEYALRTTLRMFAALGFSFVFTFIFGTLAAKSKKAEMLIIPALDILQSVPVLGFLTFTVSAFMGMFPGREMGLEMAAIFAIFTSQAWNMAFSFYQSLRTLPKDLEEVCENFRFSGSQRFVYLELPFALPGLLWNAMMSMSGGWFFVVASEAISVGDTNFALPGIGSWLSSAILVKDGHAVIYGIITMALVILTYDQLIFRPVIAWADKFRMEQTASTEVPKSWVYDLLRKTHFVRILNRIFARPFKYLMAFKITKPTTQEPKPHNEKLDKIIDYIWLVIVGLLCAYSAYVLLHYIFTHLTIKDFIGAFLMGCATLLRVIVLIIIASLIWIPLGVIIGLNKKLSEAIQPLVQFLAAFPANVLFPVAVAFIVQYHLSPNLWLSPLMILGTQWYILFNVIAGASAIPNDMKEVSTLFGIRGLKWWRAVILPAIFPYYITGAITASGGSWNASIVAEAVNWGSQQINAYGLGAYIANATNKGDFPRVILGVAVMSIFVILFNRIIWRPLYEFSSKRMAMN